MSDQMTTERAIKIALDIAARYGENAEEGFKRRVQKTDTDKQCAEIATDCVDEVIEIRDLWRATDLLNKLLEQRGCEHFDRACKDGKLTTLADIAIFG